jgi:hypothetical protein
MTILIIIGLITLIGCLFVFKLMNQSIMFLTFQVLFNYYTYLLAYLFMPSSKKIELSIDELEKERMLN